MSTDPLIGAQLGSYRLERVVGRGGMSAVYRANHVRTGRTVAVKVLSTQLAADQEYRARFVAEARRASRVDEAHIIDVYDADEEQGRLYLAMRFVEGGDLSALLRREGPLPPERAIRIVGQVGSALDAAHAQGLVHRDVKPGNILMGPNEHVFLSDFGVAKAQAGRSLTQTGMFIGSPDYAAPEQWEGQRDIDGRADQYALAGVFHECLTGARPYERDSITGLMYAHLQLPPPQVTELRPDLPGGLDAVLARAMAKDRTRRYATCGEFIAAARAAVTGTTALPTMLAGADAVEAGEPTVAAGTPTVAAPIGRTQPSAREGAAVPISTPPTTAAPPAPRRSRRALYIALAVAAVLVAAGVIVGVLVAGGGGEEGAAEFSDPPSMFQPIDRGDRSAAFRGNAYVFDLNSKGQPLISVSDRPAPLDVRVRVAAQSGAADYGAAVICRYQNAGDYYMAAVASGQRYNIVKYSGGKSKSLVGGLQPSSAVRFGDAVNTIELTCEGGGTVVLTLTVNGQLISAPADADNPLTTGKVGLRAGTGQPPARVRFTHFVMSEAS